ncbi:vWFA domain containing protein [Natranaeroarchaeum sulfidigenes]|uniref:VWFA domain containing protein n=2 Tax=Natranaeroarchaeum sulfidigenes TaxID=2784880 RepID=A0A897MRJ4_9EURY|nr:vWFA domain containing protein [Natranaeroarchaeum sulfidigenes]
MWPIMTVNITGGTSNSLPTSGGVTTIEARIDPLAKTKPTKRHVVLLIDTSGSMAGDKIDNAKNGAGSALGKLDKEDYVSVLGFDTEVQTVLPIDSWSNIDQKGANKELTNIDSGGGTDIYKGLENARDQLIEHAPNDSEAVKRIILLSDGQDRFDPETYRDLAEEYNECGISIMAAGIGGGYDEEVMLALANGSGGVPADLSQEDIDAFLDETVSDTDQVIVPNPELKIHPAHGFILDDKTVFFDAPKIEQREIDHDQSPPSVGLPELQVGDPHRLTFKILGQPKAGGLSYEIATLRVEDGSGSRVAETTVDVDYTDQAGLERVDIEENRAIAEVTVGIQDPETSETEVREKIKEIEDQGWIDTADELKQKLNTAEEAGGIIRVGKNRLDTED